jgi:hypothetical protein
MKDEGGEDENGERAFDEAEHWADVSLDSWISSTRATAPQTGKGRNWPRRWLGAKMQAKGATGKRQG